MNILFVTRTVDFIDPIGPMVLSAVAKKAGHSTRLCIVSRENIFELMNSWKPDILAFSSTTGEHGFYYRLNVLLKKYFSFFSIMGGPHPTFSPEDQEKSGIDAFCRGEGELFLLDLLTSLPDREKLRALPNIVFEGMVTEVRPLIQDLDELPFPDRDLFYSTTEMRDFPIKSFIASRGCPYPCTYCFNHLWRDLYKGKGPVVRRRSVISLIEELKFVRKNYPLGFVKFYDDIFSYRVDPWLEDFIREYRREICLPFQCYIRPELVTEELVLALKEAGCASVSMSIESGSHKLRKELLHRDMADEQLKEAFGLFKKHSIATFANTMLGLPKTTIRDDLRSVKVNVDCGVTLGLFPIFHPYPKTELGELCIKEGYFDKDYNKFNTYYVNNSPLSCFDQGQKDQQALISLWGTVAVGFPRLSRFIMKLGPKLPFRSLAFALYYVTKAWLTVSRIYPSGLDIWEGIKTAWKGWRLERAMRGVEDLNHLEESYLKTIEKEVGSGGK